MEYPKLIKEYQEIELNEIELEKKTLEQNKKLKNLKSVKKMKLNWLVFFESLVLFVLTNGLFFICNINGFEKSVIVLDPFSYMMTTIIIGVCIDWFWTESKTKFFGSREPKDSIIICVNFIFIFNIITISITILYFLIKGIYDVVYYFNNKKNESVSDVEKTIDSIQSEKKVLKEKRLDLMELMKDDSDSLYFINKEKKFKKINEEITKKLEKEYEYKNIIEHHIKNKEKEFMENF